MNILVTLNENYVQPLKVMLWSLFFNNPGENFRIFLIHSSISDLKIAELDSFISQKGQELQVISVNDDMFAEAPTGMHYSKEMYYRLLAYRLLPSDMEKILYLDPDILIINSIKELYETDITEYFFGAAYHENIPIKGINMVRLKAYEMEEYFNTGVLLMNLNLQRQFVNEDDIYSYIRTNETRLILPDQDIFNALYSKHTKKIQEVRYNYDTRHYQYYKFLSSGKVDIDYIMQYTSILHFCGKKKPWQDNYSGKFYVLYKHYETLAMRENHSRP